MIHIALALLLAGSGIGHPTPVRTIDAGELTMTIPSAGIGVQASAILSDGTELSVRIEHASSGAIAVATERASHYAAEPLEPAGAVRPCADPAFRLTGQHWTQTYHWSFRASSTPASLGRMQVRDALRRAASNITGAHNNCGRRDRVNALHRYDGVTRIRPNVTATGCDDAGRDGVNVVGFRDLPSGVVGLTCWWWIVGSPATIEADVALNKADFRWRIGRKDCSNEYLVEAVATHEFGHAFGLGHVREGRHPLLTMSESGYPCDNSPSTLGLGDLRGLEQLY